MAYVIDNPDYEPSNQAQAKPSKLDAAKKRAAREAKKLESRHHL